MNRIRGLLEYVENLPPNRIGQALEELRAGSPDWDPESRFVAHMLLTRWGQEDPEDAFASLKNLDAKRGGGDATSILASLAAVDPGRAVAWLGDPDNSLKHRPYMGHILAGAIAREWVREDPGAALDWAASLPKDQRSGAFSGVLESIASTDPERAASLAMNLEPDDRHEVVDAGVGALVKAAFDNDPEGAVTWASTIFTRKIQLPDC